MVSSSGVARFARLSEWATLPIAWQESDYHAYTNHKRLRLLN